MPVVYFTDGETETAEHLVKKEWGVITITDDEKESYPWHMVERVWEKIDDPYTDIENKSRVWQ